MAASSSRNPTRSGTPTPSASPPRLPGDAAGRRARCTADSSAEDSAALRVGIRVRFRAPSPRGHCARLSAVNAERTTGNGQRRSTAPTPGHGPLERKRMAVVDIPRPNPRKAAEFQSVPILLRIAQGLIHFRSRKPERIALWQRLAAARSRKSPDRRNDPTRRAESGTLCPLERLLHLILLVEIAPMRSGTPVRTFALRQQLTRV